LKLAVQLVLVVLLSSCCKLQVVNITGNAAGNRKKQIVRQLPAIAYTAAVMHNEPANVIQRIQPFMPMAWLLTYSRFKPCCDDTAAAAVTHQLLLLPPCFVLLLLLLQVTKGFIDPPGKNVVTQPKGVPTKEIFRRFFADPNAGKAPKNINGPADKPPKN
jgi:hypothetical protein